MGPAGERDHSGMATTEQVCHQLGLTGLQQTLILIVELQENRAGDKRFLQMMGLALACFCSTVRKEDICTERASFFLCVDQIDSQFIYLFIEPPSPDSTLSNCQTSLIEESYHNIFPVYMIARRKLIPASITLIDFSPR